MAEFDDLLTRFELGLASAAEEAALAARLRGDPAARRQLVLHARVGAALARPSLRVRPAAPRPWWRRPPVWVAAAGLAAALVLLTVNTRQPAGWRVQAGAEGATLTHAGVARPACAGDPLEPGDTLAGTATLALAGQARLELGDGGALRLDAAQRFTLSAGALTVVVAKRAPGDGLEFAAPHAVATVVGTRFTLTAAPGASGLEVAEGAVRFSTADDRGTALVEAGAAAFADAQALTAAPPAAGVGGESWPAAAGLLWRADPGQTGWQGHWQADGGLRSASATGGDTPEARAWVRSPITVDGWAVAAGARLRLRYWAAGFPAGATLRVMLKRADLTNFAHDLDLVAGSWRSVELALDAGTFLHLDRRLPPLAAGERVHGVVVVALSDRAARGRFWIRDLAVIRP